MPRGTDDGPWADRYLQRLTIPDPRPGHEGEELNAHYARYTLGMIEETEHLLEGYGEE